jgi:cell division protein FtsB
MVSCISFCWYLFSGEGGYIRLREHKSELHRLQIENLRLLETQRELYQKIDRLKSDDYEIERIARERFQLARPGDIIVNIP